MGCFTPYFVKGIYVPCGKCYDCRLNKRQAWCFRLFQELRNRPVAYFVTLTYSEENVPNKCYDVKHLDRYKANNYYTLSKEDASAFIESCQKHLRTDKQFKKKLVRYYLIGEYGDKCHLVGGTNRPHYHAIMYFPKGCTKDFAREIINSSWSYGIVDIEPVTFADINYVAKHQFKESKGNDYQRQYAPIFAKMSRQNGGLGSNYLQYVQRLKPSRLSKLYVLLNGYKIALPQFYRKKLFPDKMTDDEMTAFMKVNQDNWHCKFAAAFNITDDFRELSPLNASQADAGSTLYVEFRQYGFNLSNMRWRQYTRKKFTRRYVKNKLHERLMKSEYYVQHFQGQKAKSVNLSVA